MIKFYQKVTRKKCATIHLHETQRLQTNGRKKKLINDTKCSREFAGKAGFNLIIFSNRIPSRRLEMRPLTESIGFKLPLFVFGVKMSFNWYVHFNWILIALAETLPRFVALHKSMICQACWWHARIRTFGQLNWFIRISTEWMVKYAFTTHFVSYVQWVHVKRRKTLV